MSKNSIDTEKARIDLYPNDSQVMNDAIDKVVVELYNKRKDFVNAHKLLFTACAPQCGTTSVCISLGIALSEARMKTLIVDCDLRRTADYKKLNEKVDMGLADYLSDEGEVTPNFETIIYDTNYSNLNYIPCGNQCSNPARLFCSDIMQKLIDYANEKYDCVIFDFPSVAVAPDAQILFGKVDGIILISAFDYVTKKQIKIAKHKVQPFSDRYYGMIINRINIGLFKKYVKRYDYYFLDKKGNQRLGGSVERKHMSIVKEAKKAEEEAKKDEKKN